MRRQDLAALYELQQVDAQIAAADKTKAALDDGSALNKLIRRIEAELTTLNEQLRSLETEQRDAEMSLQTIETKKQSYQRRLYEGSVTNPKELEGMEKEIAMLERNQDKVETRILELLDAVQAQGSSVSRMQSALAAKQTELQETVRVFNDKSAQLTQRLSELKEERAQIARNIDEASLTRYDTVRQHMGGIAIGKVEDSRCDACHVGLTPYAQEALRSEDEVPQCESCGRFLYLPR